MSQSVTGAACGNPLYSLCSPSPEGLGPPGNDQERKERSVTLRRRVRQWPERLKATLRALRGLDPLWPSPLFGCHRAMARWADPKRSLEKGMNLKGGETSHHVTFYLLPRRYAPRLQCSNERTHFIFRYDKRERTTPTIWHLSS